MAFHKRSMGIRRKLKRLASTAKKKSLALIKKAKKKHIKHALPKVPKVF